MKENKNEEKKPFLNNLFNCCYRDTSEDFDLINEDEPFYNETSILSKAKKELEKDFSIFPIGIICDEERSKINFTQEGILKYIINLQNLNYENIYYKNNIKISKIDFSDICEKFPLIKCEIIKNKSDFKKIPNIQKLIDAMTNPELRKEWDDNIIEYKIIEKLNDNSEIVNIITKKQFEIIPEKEFYDKRIRIFKDEVYYLFSSSIPDSNNIISLDYDKGKNYLSVIIIKEDKKNYYIDTFNQIDLNIELPENFIDNNFPNMIKNFFEKYFEYLNTL